MYNHVSLLTCSIHLVDIGIVCNIRKHNCGLDNYENKTIIMSSNIKLVIISADQVANQITRSGTVMSLQALTGLLPHLDFDTVYFSCV